MWYNTILALMIFLIPPMCFKDFIVMQFLFNSCHLLALWFLQGVTFNPQSMSVQHKPAAKLKSSWGLENSKKPLKRKNSSNHKGK